MVDISQRRPEQCDHRRRTLKLADADHIARFDPQTVTAMLDVIEAGMQAVTSSQVDGLDSFTRRMDDLDSALVRARGLMGDNRE